MSTEAVMSEAEATGAIMARKEIYPWEEMPGQIPGGACREKR
jgi:hypothetical protein